MFLWIKAILPHNVKTLRICMCRFVRKDKGTSFFTCQKGSLTLEAAVVVPLAIGFLACILYLFRIVQVQAAVEECLMYVGRVLAVESCVLDSNEALFLDAKVRMLDALEQRDIVDTYVKHGRYGVYLTESEFEADQIFLCAEYDVKLPVKFFGIESIHLASVNGFQKWCGEGAGNEAEAYVYITVSGSVYHKSKSCRVLDLSVYSATIQEMEKIRGMDGQKYYKCEDCEIGKEKNDVVYYTDYGTRYHEDVACSALKRNVVKILKTEAGNRKACSFCFP